MPLFCRVALPSTSTYSIFLPSSRSLLRFLKNNACSCQYTCIPVYIRVHTYKSGFIFMHMYMYTYTGIYNIEVPISFIARLSYGTFEVYYRRILGVLTSFHHILHVYCYCCVICEISGSDREKLNNIDNE